MHLPSNPARWRSLAVLLTLLLAACGGGEGGSEAGGAEAGGTEPGADSSAAAGGGSLLSESYDLSGTNVRFGSKDFTEHLILGQIATQALEAAGGTAELTENLPSPAGPRDALLAGELDAYWEYTGTGWINYLGNTEPIADPMEQYEAVAEQDLEENNVYWSPPAPFDDTYGIAVRSSFAEEHNLETLADAASFIEENPDQASFCLDSTFESRDDGLPRFEETYGVEWPDDQLIVQDFGVIYQSTAEGDPCNFGEVFTTDGRIEALDLTVLEDTENAFISYLSSVTMMNEFNEANPSLSTLFEEIGQPLTEERMTSLNAAVDVDGEFPEDVAAQYLQEEGFVE